MLKQANLVNLSELEKKCVEVEAGRMSRKKMFLEEGGVVMRK